jgi:hypothetical protein
MAVHSIWYHWCLMIQILWICDYMQLGKSRIVKFVVDENQRECQLTLKNIYYYMVEYLNLL